MSANFCETGDDSASACRSQICEKDETQSNCAEKGEILTSKDDKDRIKDALLRNGIKYLTDAWNGNFKDGFNSNAKQPGSFEINLHINGVKYLTDIRAPEIEVDDSDSNDDSDDNSLPGEENGNSDEEVMRLKDNYNNIASKIVSRDKEAEVSSKIPEVMDVSDESKQFDEKRGGTAIPPLKDISLTSSNKKKKSPRDEKPIEVQQDECSDIADLIRLGIKREIKCDNTIPQDVKVMLIPNTKIVIPTRYRCKTCGSNKLFLGKHCSQRLLNQPGSCCKNLETMRLRGLGFLSLSNKDERFPSKTSNATSWGMYLQMWHGERFNNCEFIKTDLKNCANYEDGEFAMYEFQQFKCSNFMCRFRI